MASMTSPPSTAVERWRRLDGYLQQDPGNALLLADAFDAALSAGRFGEANAYLASANLSETDWQLRVATLLFAQTRYAECAERLQAFVGLPPPQRPPGAVELWLRSIHQLGDPAPAWTWLQAEAAAQAELAPPVAAVASLIAVDAGDLAAAERLADAALPALPRSMEALVAKGTAVLARRDAAAASSLAHAALAIREDGRARSLLAFADMLAGRTAQALANFERAVALMPGHVGTWQGFGWLRMCTGDLPGAQDAFETALGLDRNFADNHGSMAVLLAMQGQAEPARRFIDVAKRLDPRCMSARYAEAVLNGEAANVEKMRRLAAEIIGR